MMTLSAKPAFDQSKFLALVHQMEVREAAFLKAIPDIVVAFDSTSKCLFFYPGSGMQWPFAINDLTGRYLTDCFPQELVERLQIAARKTRISGRTEQFEFDLDMSMRQSRFFEARVVAGSEDESFVFLREVTTLREIIHSFQSSEARYRSLIENLPQAFFAKDLEGRFSYVNSEFCRFVGMPAEEILGRTDEAVFPRSIVLKFKAEDLRVLSTKRPSHNTEAHELPNGRKACIQSIKAPVYDSAGNIVGIQGILWDISDRLQLESQLRQVQKLDAIGRLSGAIAHDFNNMLTVIQGHAQLLKFQKNLSPAVLDSLKAIEGAVTRAANLTRPLLTFSRQQPFHPRVIELGKIIKDFSQMLRRVLPENIRFDIQLSETPIGLVADPSMLDQVLLNFSVNARDAMPNGGSIKIKTSTRIIRTGDFVAHPQSRPGTFGVLEVTDSGHGIPADILPQIFEPFFTTKPKDQGTGLGLATVYGIVQQHAGWIEVESEVNVGTTFRVMIPAQDFALGETQIEADQTPLTGEEAILVVEDEEPVRTFLTTMLRGQGYTVHAAATASEAVQQWNESGKKIDLLLTDMVLPEDVNGRELALRLMDQKPELKTLVFSGYLPQDSGRDLESLGIDFLEKPAPVHCLLKQIRKLLESPSRASKTRIAC
ncbi:MAG TPA: ATP-binding protein [Candidatus Kapabacteria bacterium]|nr:ATP-binding protein [Candidatus Kapabacteria bacterium]